MEALMSIPCAQPAYVFSGKKASELCSTWTAVGGCPYMVIRRLSC